MFQSPMYGIPADCLPPLHGPPIGELVEVPANSAGQLISRSTLCHALPLRERAPKRNPRGFSRHSYRVPSFIQGTLPSYFEPQAREGAQGKAAASPTVTTPQMSFFRFWADVLRVRGSVTTSYSTFWPSVRRIEAGALDGADMDEGHPMIQRRNLSLFGLALIGKVSEACM